MLNIVPAKQNTVVFRGIRNIPKSTNEGIRWAFQRHRKDLVKFSRKSMRKPKHGRWYVVYKGIGGRRLKKGRLHRASKKGESPAVLTNALSKSLATEVKGAHILTFGADTPYARRHELDGRSYLMESITAQQRDLEKYVERGIRLKMKIKGGRR